MFTKISTSVAFAAATTTASAHAATGLKKRDGDQDNSAADVAILANNKKVMKPSLRVDDQGGDVTGMLVNHVEQVNEKPLKNQQRRRVSSRRSRDLGILGKNQEKKFSTRHQPRHFRHQRRRERRLDHCPVNPYSYTCFYIYTQSYTEYVPDDCPNGVYRFEFDATTGFQSELTGDICVSDPENGYTYCYYNLLLNGISTFSMLPGETDGAFTLSVDDVASYPCGVPGGLSFEIHQVEGADGSPREFEVAQGVLLDSNNNPDCDTFAEVNFQRVEKKASKSCRSSSVKSSKSKSSKSKSSKSKRSKSGGP